MGIYSENCGPKKPVSRQREMRCVFCNAPTTLEQGTLIRAEDFRSLLKKGFAIHESDIKMLMDSGLSREQAVEMLRARNAAFQSDWLLCPECALRLASKTWDEESALELLIDNERAVREGEICADSPEYCDVCHQPFAGHRFMIDGQIEGTLQTLVQGQTMYEWGYMCAKCFAARGVGIRWGAGQLYQRTRADQWLLVAGFRPESDDDT